ncbi:WXG100-like domain-containing protein [Nocardia sp. NPDC004260]
MPIEMPSEVALFLNLIGIPYPDINADDVRALGMHVRSFAENVASTHELASGAINDMGSVYSGYSYQQLVASWARMSATHMADLDRGCHVVAEALRIAADVITAVQVAVLAELAALAASYAVVLATPGAAAYSLAVREVAGRLCRGMEDMILSYIAAEVIERAIQPLEDTIDRLVNGFVLDAAHELLGIPSPEQSAATPLYIEPDEVLRYANILDGLADDILKHAATFAEDVAGLNFTTSDNLGIESAVRPSGVSATSIQPSPLPSRGGVLVEPSVLTSPPNSTGHSASRAELSTHDESRQLSSVRQTDSVQPAGEPRTRAMSTGTGTSQHMYNGPEAGAAVMATGEPSMALADSHHTPDQCENARASSPVSGSHGYDPTLAENRSNGSESEVSESEIRESSYTGPIAVTEDSAARWSPQLAEANSTATATPWTQPSSALKQEKFASKASSANPSKATSTAAPAATNRSPTPWSRKKRGSAESKTVEKVFTPTRNEAVPTAVAKESAADQDTKHHDSEGYSGTTVREIESTSPARPFRPRVSADPNMRK